MRPQRARRVIVIALLACAGIPACSAGRDPIRIGLAGSFTDPVGTPMLLAARLAVEEINAAGGVRGRPLELIEREDFADPDSAIQIAVELQASDAVAVIGHLFSSTSLAAAPVYNSGERPIVELSPSSSAPQITDAGPWTFRLCPSDLAHGSALARWAADQLKLTDGAIMYLNDEYGRGIRQAFAQRFVERGGRLQGVEPYLGGTPDLRPNLERLKQMGRARFLMIAGNRGEAEQILRDGQSLGITLPLLGGDGLEGLEQAGALGEGAYISAAYHPGISTSRNRQFIDAYRRKYPDARLPNQPAAATYDAVKLLALVVSEAGTGRRAVRDRLAQVGRESPAFEGATSRIAFDSQGDVSEGQVYITMVRSGQVLLAGGS